MTSTARPSINHTPAPLEHTMSTTLHIRIGSSPDRSDLEKRFEAIDTGDIDDIEPREPTLSIENLETFGRIFRPTNLELLEAIVEHDPESIRALARAVGRHPPEVLDNVRELADYGLIDLEQEGRAKRPVVWYDEIDVDIPLRGHSAGTAPA